MTPLLALLLPTESSPQLLIQTLRTLNSIADSINLSGEKYDGETGLPIFLYTDHALSSLTTLLSQDSASFVVHQQVALTAALICKTCQDEYHQAMIVQAGILEALAVALTPCIVDTVLETSMYDHSFQDAQSYAAKSGFAPILHAIGVIIKGSRSRAIQFLNAPGLTNAFQCIELHANPKSERKSSRELHSSSIAATRQGTCSFLDSLLPPMPVPHTRNGIASPSGFPPLDAIRISGRQSLGPRSLSTAIEIFQSQGLEYVGEEESRMIPWLMYVSRFFDGVMKLDAAWVLAILCRQRFAKGAREATIALSIVPSLVRMLDKDYKVSLDNEPPCEHTAIDSPDKVIKEQAPAVLAMLTVNNKTTQKAAADAGAIKKLSQLLKGSYDPTTADLQASLWSPEVLDYSQPEERDPSSSLGPAGITSIAHHIIRMRETVLIALAALASDKDEYRKAVIEHGVIQFVIRALRLTNESKPRVVSELSDQARDSQDPSEKPRLNGKSTILAACGAARALSRSVHTLRTSLMDAGLADPLFKLLRCEDIEIQVAATAVVCNLVLEFSPMREVRSLSLSSGFSSRLIEWQLILDGGILKILCDHAHSLNAHLRLNSMWALKHLVVGASTAVKMTCLDELGASWLKQVVSDEPEVAALSTAHRHGDRDDGSTTPIRMSTPNAAGEQVDLLNAVDDGSRPPSQDREEDGEEDLQMSDSIGALSRAELDQKQQAMTPAHGRTNPSETTGEVKGLKSSQSALTLPDEIAIVKEGLEFIRNIIMGPNAAEMIDHVFSKLGQDKVFDILATKIRPKVLNAFNRDRRSSENNGVRHIQPQTDILKSACYIIVHIAAGAPRHRQLLISQTELLKLLVPLFNHPNEEIRCCCAWLIINLTWEDDASDKANCKSRAKTLMSLGMFEKLEAMEHDSDLNCRERCKSALHQMSTLLRLP